MRCIFFLLWDNDFNLTLRKCMLKKNRQREGLQKQKRQVLPVVVPEAKTGEFILPLSFLLLSFLLCSFCPEFFSSSCISVSHHAFSNIALPYLPRPVFLFAIHLSFVFVHFTPPLSFNCLSLCHFAAPSLFPTPLSLSLSLPLLTLPLFFYFSLCCSFCLPSPPLTANVCDEEMLLCQNGGTCYQNQKCICPPEFKGVLCQQSRCEAGKDCNAASSLQLSTATLLLCTLLAHLLVTLSPHWATKTPSDRGVCVYVCVREARGDPERVGPSQSWTRRTHTAALAKAHTLTQH